MPERRHRPDKPDLDEPFSLYPMEGEDVLRRLLRDDEDDDPPGED